MSTFFLILHSWLRWLILIAAIWTIIQAISGMATRRPYGSADSKSSLFFSIFMDLQFLIGIILYFVNGWARNWTGGHIKEMMSNPAQRFFTLEHIVMMIIALILVHIGRSVVKKTSVDRKKHSKSLVYFGIAFILILLAVPWPFRIDLGFHPWFRV